MACAEACKGLLQLDPLDRGDRAAYLNLRSRIDPLRINPLTRVLLEVVAAPPHCHSRPYL